MRSISASSTVLSSRAAACCRRCCSSTSRRDDERGRAKELARKLKRLQAEASGEARSARPPDDAAGGAGEARAAEPEAGRNGANGAHAAEGEPARDDKTLAVLLSDLKEERGRSNELARKVKRLTAEVERLGAETPAVEAAAAERAAESPADGPAAAVPGYTARHLVGASVAAGFAVLIAMCAVVARLVIELRNKP